MAGKQPKKFPVKYVLYSHYGNQEKEDFKFWKDDFKLWKSKKRGEGETVGELPGIQFLILRFRALRDLLTAPGYEGLVVLFYAPGLTECFDGIAQGKKRKELLEECDKLRFAEEVSSYVSEVLKRDNQLHRRIRFVTALDLYGIFARVRAVHAGELRWWFIGKNPGIHYDTPKIVEAIVRLRLLGNGVPVFRLDWDVLFSSDKPVSDLGLFKAVAICLKAYRLRLEDPSVATFLFSASYDYANLRTSPSSSAFEDWRGAFATRVFPALPIVQDLVDVASVKQIKEEKKPDIKERRITKNKPSPWEEYAEKVFSEPLARKFYGFDPDRLTCGGRTGIVKIGAHPLTSVISGAFFCLSDGAILDLPPFSNFSLNVSWIDDHLKYCLHRELRHLTSVDLQLSEPCLSDAKLDEVMLTKARMPIDDLPKYALEQYLPTLLWGTILDAWINPNPLLKYRPETLPKAQAAQLNKVARRGVSDSVLPRFLQVAAETSGFSLGEQVELEELLTTKALVRINEVRALWADLTDDDDKIQTFASIWARGTVNKYFPKLKGRALGIAPGTPWGKPICDLLQLNPPLLQDIKQLIEDTVQYVDWTNHWPGIVRIVRSIEQGTIRTDISWPLPERPRVKA